MDQAASLPSATASTAVSAVPAMSPPQKTLGVLVLVIVIGSISTLPHLFSLIPSSAALMSSEYNPEPNARNVDEKNYWNEKWNFILENVSSLIRDERENKNSF